jgi:RNA polymerase sigma-70 factor (ECF subfamily)
VESTDGPLRAPFAPARGCSPLAAPLRQNLPMDRDPGSATARLEARPAGVAGSYTELRTALLAFLRKHTGDAQVAEDLLHDVVVKALVASQDDTQAPRNLTGWLYAVARNAAMDHHRRQRPTEELPEELAAPDDDEAVRLRLAACLRPMAQRLPDTYRDTVIAAEFDGLPLAEIARRQGLSLSAVKTRASRGRRLLQEALVRCCDVAVSANGQVVDYDAREAKRCSRTATGCGSARPGPH